MILVFVEHKDCAFLNKISLEAFCCRGNLSGKDLGLKVTGVFALR